MSDNEINFEFANMSTLVHKDTCKRFSIKSCNLALSQQNIFDRDLTYFVVSSNEELVKEDCIFMSDISNAKEYYPEYFI